MIRKITKTKTQNNYNSFEPRVKVEKYTLKNNYEAGISIMWVNIQLRRRSNSQVKGYDSGGI